MCGACYVAAAARVATGGTVAAIVTAAAADVASLLWSSIMLELLMS